ncbi:transposase [Patescibacteria group bacterium]
MPKRKIEFYTGGTYHIYNRGVDKRDIVTDQYDQLRFLRTLNIFNTTEHVGSVYEYDVCTKKRKLGAPSTKLVEIIAFNLLDNHYHLILRQLVDGGISKFMQSFSAGYVMYFNNKHERSGPLFQGAFKASPVGERKEEIIAYVNLNHVIHGLGAPSAKWGIRSSWREYGDKMAGIVEIKKWKDFNKKRSIEIARKVKQERDEVKKNEFE